jgi:hypothetical protein
LYALRLGEEVTPNLVRQLLCNPGGRVIHRRRRF